MPLSPVSPGESIDGFPGDQLPTHQIVVRFKGVVDYTYVYRTIQRWFEQRRFRFYDTRYKDTGKRIKNDLHATRNIDEFFSERYKITVEMWNLTTTEILVKGEPRKLINGQVQFTISGQILTDRGGWFKGTSLKRLLGRIYMDVRWREIEMKYIDTMEYRTQDIQTMIKETLNMRTKENTAW